MVQGYGTGTLEDKILIVVFIVITTVANAEYLFRYFRTPGALYRNGHFVKISLALGNIILTFFSYVVLAIIIYEGFSQLACRTVITFQFYLLFFYPFVFGLGIFALNLDFFFMKRAARPPRSKWASLILAVTLWVFSCVSIVPLGLKGVDWNISCIHPWASDDWALLLVVGRLIPAIFAILSCLALLNVCLQRPHANTINLEKTDAVPTTRLQDLGDDATARGETEHRSEQTPTQPVLDKTIQEGTQLRDQSTTDDRNAILQSWEKRGLLLASAFYFCSVVPYTLYAFTYDPSSPDDDSSRGTIVRSLLWISFLYPIAVPVAWRGQVQM